MRAFWLFGILVYISTVNAVDLIVDLPYGTIKGRKVVTAAKKTFRAFQGIPYAAPPVGALRFQAPEQPKNWTGIKETIRDSHSCFSVTGNSNNENEDCLYINVFTPVLSRSNSTTSKLPVMLWMYGGAYRTGSASYHSYGPDYLIEKDVIIVTFNYRVGPFGFLATEDGVVYGNAGLKDQAAAIKWVHEHISLFGGDPEKITIFGQSAGGSSVGYQLLYKKNQGLIRGAILQSGSPLSQFSFMGDISARAYAFDLASQIDKTIEFQNDTRILMNFLMNATGRQIDTASTKTTVTGRALPVIEPDHDGAFITKESYELLENGDFLKVPIMIGMMSEEAMTATDLDTIDKELAKYERNHELFVPSKGFHVKNGISKITLGDTLYKTYFTNVTTENKPGTYIKFLSDNRYNKPVIRHAEFASALTDAYLYEFSYDGPMGNFNRTVQGAGKVGHGEDQKYMWKVESSTYSNADLSRFPEKDVLTHKRVIELWTNFAKYLNPTPEPIDLLQNVTWPRVQPNSIFYLNIGDDLIVQKNPKSPHYDVWKEIYNDWNQRPFTVF